MTLRRVTALTWPRELQTDDQAVRLSWISLHLPRKV